ncbi:hypothetical protein E2C01_034256 [Portunus trituberculatus]|uniref:Uncharacterized protein n=1 Tax=Portunus trituberculatus TaxID=210409 RepID=A0A5B7F0Z0_PORTR|nr:hypothetical protein [Portunus trituberculatus]
MSIKWSNGTLILRLKCVPVLKGLISSFPYSFWLLFGDFIKIQKFVGIKIVKTLAINLVNSIDPS